MTDIPTSEPEKFAAGDYVQWKKLGAACVNPAGDACLASAGWELTYALVNSGGKIDITAVAATDDFLITLAAAATALYSAGIYSWQAYVTKTTERYLVDSGTIEISPNFAGKSAAGYDDRSHVKRVLDALEATLEQRASRDQSATVIGGEVVGKMPIQRLLEFRDKYKNYYEQEKRAERVKNGLGHDGNILVRFSDA